MRILKEFVVLSLRCVWLFATPWAAARQASLSLTVSQSLLRFMSVESVIPPNHLILCRPPLPPALYLSQCQGLFQWVGSSHRVAKGLELQHQSFQWIFRTEFLYNWFVWSSCSPRDFEKSSLTPQCKSISPLVLSLLYGPTLTSTHDYWKNWWKWKRRVKSWLQHSEN